MEGHAVMEAYSLLFILCSCTVDEALTLWRTLVYLFFAYLFNYNKIIGQKDFFLLFLLTSFLLRQPTCRVEIGNPERSRWKRSKLRGEEIQR